MRTEEQNAAIAARGKVIVSASAGSGKTTVMIDRLVGLILGGADIRSILAVTFTTKAAAQMKEKLRSALIKQIASADGEERARLKDQLSALPLADISTIHAFCARLVRTYFYLVQVDPAFRIVSLDDPEGCRLFSAALDEVFEQGYSEVDEEFKFLLSAYFYKKKDARLKKIISSLLRAVRGRADFPDFLETEGQRDEFERVCRYLFEDLSARAKFYAGEAEKISAYFSERGDKAAEVSNAVLESANRILQRDDLFSMAEEAARGIFVPRMPNSNKYAGEARKEFARLKDVSAAVKELYKELCGYSPREEEYARYQNGQAQTRALAKLVLRCDEAYSRFKREADALDYDDLERFALHILSNSDALFAVRQKYSYVFVDEYQDVNPAQEKILSLVGGEEIFLVGDAKQSIYAFRGSRSEFFLQKERDFPKSYTLSENFRSSRAVLSAVNRIFSAAMTKESCGIDYASRPMRGGTRYGGHDGGVFFRPVPVSPEEKRERGIYSVLREAAPRTDAQAEAIAELVREEFGSEYFDPDSGLTKKVGWGDIAILARKKSGDAEKIVAALSENNIPVTASASVNVCEYFEARLIIDWLSYLDDPEQDIPFAGAMLSRIGGFGEAELMRIRKSYPLEYAFRAAAERYRKEFSDEISKKLQAFSEKTERFRAALCVRTAAEIGNLLLFEGLEAQIAAKEGGTARIKRVRRLLSGGTDCTVNEFLQKLKAASYCVEDSESGGDDAVKVLTMHAAKGLEYPVVILAGMNKPFHGPDVSDVIVTQEFGFAPRCIQADKRLVKDTVLRRASNVFLKREEIKEELNLFYVALTRAKYRLHLFFEKAENALSPLHANCFADFIDFSSFQDELRFCPPASKKPQKRSALVPQRNPLCQEILSVFCVPYPHRESCLLPVKSSATQLLHALREESPRPFRNFKGGQRASAEEGTAYHAFLQNVVFGREAGEELCRMQREGVLSREQIGLLNEEELEKILKIPAFAELEGKKTFREQKFLIRLPANEMFDSEEKDEILLQGAIDLFYADEAGYTILDYKYSSRGAEELKETYRTQIAIYRKAVSKALRIKEDTIRAKILNIKLMFETEL